jgi:hypothetical protein
VVCEITAATEKSRAQLIGSPAERRCVGDRRDQRTDRCSGTQAGSEFRLNRFGGVGEEIITRDKRGLRCGHDAAARGGVEQRGVLVEVGFYLGSGFNQSPDGNFRQIVGAGGENDLLGRAIAIL